MRSGVVLPGCGMLIVLLIAVAVSLHVPGSIWVGTLARKDAVVTLIGISAGLYFLAIAKLLRAPPPARALWWILGIAAVLRLVLLVAPPFMSSDVYRYVWDGRVQTAGVNPYLHIPADPALAGLRDGWIYPRINRADYAHTIYPPAAQLLFALVAQASQTVTAMKLAMLLLEACAVAAMLRLLRIAGLQASRVLIYAWNPLAAWAIAGDGHIDGAAIGLLGLAMLAAVLRHRVVAGVLLGAAILTKFLPLAVAPAIWRRWDWRLPLACGATVVALYAVYSAAGLAVFGFLPSYTSEEGLAQGSGFWLLALLSRWMRLPPWAGHAYVIIAALLLLGIASWMAFFQRPATSQAARARQLGGNVAILAAATVAAMSPHYPWYYVWLALPCCLCAIPSVIFLSAAPLLLYSDPWHDEIWLPTAVFVPAAALALRDIARSRAHGLMPELPARSI